MIKRTVILTMFVALVVGCGDDSTGPAAFEARSPKPTAEQGSKDKASNDSEESEEAEMEEADDLTESTSAVPDLFEPEEEPGLEGHEVSDAELDGSESENN